MKMSWLLFGLTGADRFGMLRENDIEYPSRRRLKGVKSNEVAGPLLNVSR